MSGYSRGPKFLKGAIVQFKPMPIIPIPNIILFQYNPETYTRSISVYKPGEKKAAASSNDGAAPAEPQYTQPTEPLETFSISLLLDATDALEVPESHPVAFVTGVSDRLAALEMLLYPTKDSLLGGLLGSVSVSLGSGGVSASMSKDKFVGRPEVPVTLFIWGPGRIVPVRLTQFSVDEQQWNQLLYPTRAKVTLGMTVITSAELDKDENSATSGKGLAKFCYDWTRGQKEVLALANIANTVESILGILPF